MFKKIVTELRTLALMLACLAYLGVVAVAGVSLFASGSWFLALVVAAVLLFVGRLILAHIGNKAFDKRQAATLRTSQG